MFVLSQNSKGRAGLKQNPAQGYKRTPRGCRPLIWPAVPFFINQKPVKMEFSEKAKEGRRRYAAQYRKIKKAKMHAHQNRFYEKMADQLPADTPKVEQSR